jgi:uncharacterized phage protein gp47/JayE
MAFERPSLTEIIERTFADLTSRLNLQGALLRRSVVGVLARVLAGASHMLHAHLDWISKQAMPDTATGLYLERWAAIWGVARKEAEFAEGSTINLTGTVDGTIVPAGTVLQRSDGVQFETDADVTIASGVATAAITALEAGALGNAAAGATLNLVFPIAGVSSTATVAGDGIVNGSDVDDDESLRARMLSRIKQPPHGGAEFDYEMWALEVPGVTRAWVYPLHLGPGTVGVSFVRDNDANFIPDTGEVTAVQDYIDERRPVTADVTVFAPVADTLNFTIAVDPNTAAIKSAVEAELRDLLLREAEPGGTIYLSRINEAISLAAGEFDHVLTAPSADVAYATGHIAKFGAITWA